MIRPDVVYSVCTALHWPQYYSIYKDSKPVFIGRWPGDSR